MELNEILVKVQKELKAPKGQTNKFGNYKYRSCEDIVEAVKPLLHKEGAFLAISDELVRIGDRYYVKATASVVFNDKQVYTSAYAREAEDKKGMDVAQITGAASSYARKYALNGLFAIDDTKDADTQDNTKSARINPDQKKEFVAQVKQALETGDDEQMKVLWSEWDADEKVVLWREFSAPERSTMKEMMK